MKHFLRMTILALFFGVSLNPLYAAEQQHFTVRIPTCDEEAEYLWGVLENYRFYSDNNYEVALPTQSEILPWIGKAKNGDLKPSDVFQFKKDFRTVYSADNYRNGYLRAMATLPLLESVYAKSGEYVRLWDFYRCKRYTILLTLYGSGGSYNAGKGQIITFVTIDGSFKYGRRPEELFVHEMTHIGLENAIVRKYGLSHWEKERLVDRFVEGCFADVLPVYQMQNIALPDLDAYLDGNGWNDLRNAIKNYKRR